MKSREGSTLFSAVVGLALIAACGQGDGATKTGAVAGAGGSMTAGAGSGSSPSGGSTPPAGSAGSSGTAGHASASGGAGGGAGVSGSVGMGGAAGSGDWSAGAGGQPNAAGAGGEASCEHPAGSYLCRPARTASSIDELITSCPPAAVLDAIDVDFDIRFEFVSTDPAGPALVCTEASGSRDLTHTQERIYQALIALRALELDGELPFTSLPLYEWMAQSIAGIRMVEGVGSSCCEAPSGASGAYVTIQSDTGRTWLTSDLWSMTWGGGLFDLVQLLVHETRHANGPLHTCAANDETIAEGGAWAAVYHFARAVAFDSDACFMRPFYGADAGYPDPALNEADYLVRARTYSRDVHETRFCSEPSDPAEPPEDVTVCPD